MYNIYCDESCHMKLSKKVMQEELSMVLGGIICPAIHVRDVYDKIRAIKEKHGFNRSWEVKWTKVSDAKLDFYIELLDYFFNEANLGFRAIVRPDKRDLIYQKHTHEDLYYIMYYYLLREMIKPNTKNNIYIDKKDAYGGIKVRKVKEYLCNTKLDFNHEIIQRMQIIDSKQSEIMQISDLLIGAVSYANRELDILEKSSKAKVSLVNYIRDNTNLSLLKSTLPSEKKFNIFIWNWNNWV